jgi:hypothetical protein
LGGPGWLRPGNFSRTHGIWSDSLGDLYVSEVNYSAETRIDPAGLSFFAEVYEDQTLEGKPALSIQ